MGKCIRSTDSAIASLTEVDKLSGTESNANKIAELKAQKEQATSTVSIINTEVLVASELRILDAHAGLQSGYTTLENFLSGFLDLIETKQVSQNAINDFDSTLITNEKNVKVAYDSVIKIDSTNSSLLIKENTEYGTKIANLKRKIGQKVAEIKTRENSRKKHILDFSTYMVDNVMPLLVSDNIRIDVDKSNIIYDKAEADFKTLSVSEIREIPDEEFTQEFIKANVGYLANFKTRITARKTEIAESTTRVTNSRDLLSSNIGKTKDGWLTAFFDNNVGFLQSDIDKKTKLIQKSRVLLNLYDIEIGVYRGVYTGNDPSVGDVPEVTAFKTDYLAQQLELEKQDITNKKNQKTLDDDTAKQTANELRKVSDIASLILILDIQSSDLLSVPPTFDLVEESAKLTIFKNKVNDLVKTDPTQKDKYNHVIQQVELKHKSRKEQLTQYEAITNPIYDTTKKEIDELIPTPNSFVSFFKWGTPNLVYDDVYFGGIDEKLIAAQATLATFEETVKNEKEILSPTSERMGKITNLLHELTDALKSNKEKVSAEKIKYNSDLEIKLVTGITQDLNQFGEDSNKYEEKIILIGIDKSSTLCNGILSNLTKSDQTTTTNKGLNQKAMEISGIIEGLKLSRTNLEAQSHEVDLQINVMLQTISESDSESDFLNKTSKLIELFQDSIKYKTSLVRLQPSDRNKQSISDQTQQMNEWNTKTTDKKNRIESMKQQNILLQRSIRDGLHNTIDTLEETLDSSQPFNTQHFENSNQLLSTLESTFTLLVPATSEQRDYNTILSDKIDELKRRVSSQNNDFAEFKGKEANVVNILMSDDALDVTTLGSDAVVKLHEALTTTYDIFKTGDPLNKYANFVNHPTIYVRYISLVGKMETRMKLIQQSYKTFNEGMPAINKLIDMVQTMVNEYQIVAPSGGEDPYFTEVESELFALDQLLDTLEISSSALVRIIGSGETENITKTTTTFVETQKGIIRDMRGKIRIQMAEKNTYDEERTKKQQHDQKIKIITDRFDSVFDVNFPEKESDVNLNTGQSTLSLLSAGIESLRTESADLSIIENAVFMYNKFNNSLTTHQTKLETAEKNTNNSKSKVTSKLKDLDTAKLDVLYLESFDENVKELQKLRSEAVEQINIQNTLKNIYDGPTEDVILYTISIDKELTTINNRVVEKKAEITAEKEAYDRKVLIEKTIQTVHDTIEQIKTQNPDPVTINNCSDLVGNINKEYDDKFENLNPTAEETLGINIMKNNDLLIPVEQLNQLITERRLLTIKADALKINIETPIQWVEHGEYFTEEIQHMTQEYIDTLKQINKISGEDIYPNIKDAEASVQWFQTQQVNSRLTTINETRDVAKQKCDDLKETVLIIPGHFVKFQEDLSLARESLENVKKALNSYYETGKQYVPEFDKNPDNINGFIEVEANSLTEFEVGMKDKYETLMKLREAQNVVLLAKNDETQIKISVSDSSCEDLNNYIVNENLDIKILTQKDDNIKKDYENAMDAFDSERILITNTANEDEKSDKLEVLNTTQQKFTSDYQLNRKNIYLNQNVRIMYKSRDLLDITTNLHEMFVSVDPKSMNIDKEKISVVQIKDLIENLENIVEIFGQILGQEKENPHSGVVAENKARLADLENKIKEREDLLFSVHEKSVGALKDAKILSDYSTKTDQATQKTMINDRYASLIRVESALSNQLDIITITDSRYIDFVEKTLTWVTNEETQISMLEKQFADELRLTFVKQINTQIQTELKNGQDTIQGIKYTLLVVNDLYGNLIKDYISSPTELENVIQTQTDTNTSLEARLKTLLLEVTELTAESEKYSQTLTAFENSFSTHPDPNVMLINAKDLLEGAEKYIVIVDQIAEKKGLSKSDVSFVLHNVLDFIHELEEDIKNNKDTENFLAHLELQFQSKTSLGEASFKTETAKTEASSHITLLDDSINTQSVSESMTSHGRAQELIGLVNAAANNEIHQYSLLVGSNIGGFNVETKTSEIKLSTDAFIKEQNIKLEEILKKIKKKETSELLDDERYLKNLQSISEQTKNEVNRLTNQLQELNGKINFKKAGEYLFEFHEMFSNLIDSSREALTKYEGQCVTVMNFIDKSKNQDIGIDVATYRAEVKQFVTSTNSFLSALELSMKARETEYELQGEKDKMKIQSDAIESFRTDLRTLLNDIKTKIGLASASNLYSNFGTDIALANNYIKNIRNFSTEQDLVQNQKDVEFLKEMEKKIDLLFLEHDLKLASILSDTHAKQILNDAEHKEKWSELNRLKIESDRLNKERAFPAGKTGYDWNVLIGIINNICLFLYNFLVRRTRYVIGFTDVLRYFAEFFTKNSLNSTAFYDNAIILVQQLEAIGGGFRAYGYSDASSYFMAIFDSTIAVNLLFKFIGIVKKVSTSGFKKNSTPGTADVKTGPGATGLKGEDLSATGPSATGLKKGGPSTTPSTTGLKEGGPSTTPSTTGPKKEGPGTTGPKKEGPGTTGPSMTDSSKKKNGPAATVPVAKTAVEKNQSASNRSASNRSGPNQSASNQNGQNQSASNRNGQNQSASNQNGQNLGAQNQTVRPNQNADGRVVRAALAPSPSNTTHVFPGCKEYDKLFEREEIPVFMQSGGVKEELSNIQTQSLFKPDTFHGFEETFDDESGRTINLDRPLDPNKNIKGLLGLGSVEDLDLTDRGAIQNASQNTNFDPSADFTMYYYPEGLDLTGQGHGGFDPLADFYANVSQQNPVGSSAESSFGQQNPVGSSAESSFGHWGMDYFGYGFMNIESEKQKKAAASADEIAKEDERIRLLNARKIAVAKERTDREKDEKTDQKLRIKREEDDAMWPGDGEKIKEYLTYWAHLQGETDEEYNARIKAREQKEDADNIKILEDKDAADEAKALKQAAYENTYDYILAENVQYFTNEYVPNLWASKKLYTPVADFFKSFFYSPLFSTNFTVYKNYITPPNKIGVVKNDVVRIYDVDWSETQHKKKYYNEVTCKFLPTISSIRANDLNIYDGTIVDVLADGRCFSASAYYLLEREGQWFKDNSLFKFTPSENPRDSSLLNTWIKEKIIIPIKNKRNSLTETDLVQFVYSYSFKTYKDNEEELIRFFKVKERYLITEALDKLFKNKVLKKQLDEVNRFFNESDEKDIHRDIYKAHSYGIEVPEFHKFDDLNDSVLVKLLGVENVSKITFENLNTKLLQICNEIKGEDGTFDLYYTPYIAYVESLNQANFATDLPPTPVEETGVYSKVKKWLNGKNKKPSSYEWTEPDDGPAQVLADLYHTNVIIRMESVFRDVLQELMFSPRSSNNEKIVTEKTIYILYRNINQEAHYVALVNPKIYEKTKSSVESDNIDVTEVVHDTSVSIPTSETKSTGFFGNLAGKVGSVFLPNQLKDFSFGGGRRDHDYDTLFQQEFEMEPKPVIMDYNQWFEMEPEPVIMDYNQWFELDL